MAGITSSMRHHLSAETILRIEVSLSSRKSSVVVFDTTCRLYKLDGGEWFEVAYGAPCISLIRETTAPDSSFYVNLVIAELESGLSIWEEEMGPDNAYTELQPTYHSFKADGRTMALTFVDGKQAGSLVQSLQQYLEQKSQVDKMLEQRKKGSATSSKADKRKSYKKSKLQKPRLSKSDISLPCNFQHLSGLTLQRTDECEQELEGSIQRRIRSQSLSSLKKEGQDMTDAMLSVAESTKVGTSSHSPNGKKKSKFYSLRLTKRKALVEEFDYDVINDDTRLSKSAKPRVPIPSYFRNACDGNDSLIVSKEPANKVATGWDEGNRFASTVASPATKEQPTLSTMPPLQLELDPVSTQSTFTPPPTQPTPPLQKKPAGPDECTVMSLPNSPMHSNKIRQETIQSPSKTSPSTSTSLARLQQHEVHGTFYPALANGNIQPCKEDKFKDIKPTFEKYDQLLPLEKGSVAKPLPPYRPSSNRRLANKHSPKRSSCIDTHSSSSSGYSPKRHSTIDMRSRPLPDLPVVQQKPVQSTNARSSSFDCLTDELSRVLREFDELITPSTTQSHPKHTQTLV